MREPAAIPGGWQSGIRSHEPNAGFGFRWLPQIEAKVHLPFIGQGRWSAPPQQIERIIIMADLYNRIDKDNAVVLLVDHQTGLEHFR